MNYRRKLIVALVAATLAAPFASFAQQPAKVWRLGHLALTSGPDDWDAAFREQLQALGYVEGRNLLIEYRWADGKQERVQKLAEELVRLNVDAIVTRSTFVAAAAKRATSTIPIVMANSSDPVGNDVIARLPCRPHLIGAKLRFADDTWKEIPWLMMNVTWLLRTPRVVSGRWGQ